VDARGDDPRWSEAFPWLAQTGQDRKLRRLLSEAEALHRSSAVRLRELGQYELARQAEQFARWARFDLDEPVIARRLYAVTKDLREIPELRLLLARVLEGALDLAGADRGNVQILDQETGSLRIAVQHGFGAEFLDYFAVVDDERSACGRAAKERVQAVIVDVSMDPGFAPHRGIAAASAFRAVQSTPLIDRTERLLGVVSTHYPYPHSPSARDLEILKRYGYVVGQVMTHHLAENRARRSARLSAQPGR
jgi:GAF domain-containing protein